MQRLSLAAAITMSALALSACDRDTGLTTAPVSLS
jgi:hypothetical protein